MIGLLLAIAGVVGLSIDEQFHGQTTIAFVLVVLGALILLVQVIAGILATRSIFKAHKAFRDDFHQRGRGF